MNNTKKYLSVFGIGSLFGIANELLRDSNHWCLECPSKKSILTMSAFNIYGWAMVICTAIFDFIYAYFPNIAKNSFCVILIATIFVSLFEGISGQISKIFHDGKKTWQYPKSWIPFMDNYVSVMSSLYFGFAIAIFYYVLYRPIIR
jgi:hypothetical protein